MKDIYCLINRGPGLTNYGRDLLYTMAQEMFGHKRRRMVSETQDAGLVITTKFETASVGCVFGTKFVATLVSKKTGIESEVEFVARQEEDYIRELRESGQIVGLWNSVPDFVLFGGNAELN